MKYPPGFGRDLTNQRSPEVGFWVDGAMPFRGETTKGYVTGLMLRYGQDLAIERVGPNAVSGLYLGGLNIENRFRYNQGFKSVFSMVPSVFVMMLVLDPGHYGDHRRGAREGDRLDLQLSFYADQQIRVPDGQAAPLRRSSAC